MLTNSAPGTFPAAVSGSRTHLTFETRAFEINVRARTDRRRSRTHPGFNALLKLLLGTYFRLRFNVHSRNRQAIESVRPPYLLLATHVGFWDPFVISCLTPHSIHWVAADQTFRSPIQGYFLQFFGAIPKTKGVSDFETIREIRRICRDGGVVGLFPEGQRTWDGVTLELLPATAKLARFLRVPVVVARFKGGYFAHPRWARSPRRGKLLVEYEHAFDPDELRRLPAQEIHEKLERLLAHDDYELRNHRLHRFRGRHRAEYIENVLFFCPYCGATDSIRSHRSDLHCRSCGMQWHYTLSGSLALKNAAAGPDGEVGTREYESRGEQKRTQGRWEEGAREQSRGEKGPRGQDRATVPFFSTVRDWNRWQLEELRRYIQAAGQAMTADGDYQEAEGARGVPEADKPEATIFEERGIVVHTGFRSARIRRLGRGTLRLYRDRMVFQPVPRHAASSDSEPVPEAPPIVFQLRDVDGINIQLVRKLELYHNETLYTFDPESTRTNMYKWYMALEYLADAQGLDISAPEGAV